MPRKLHNLLKLGACRRRSKSDPQGVRRKTWACPNRERESVLRNLLHLVHNPLVFIQEKWCNAYQTVTLPDDLSGIREAFQAAFGRDVRSVAPTHSSFGQFNGIYIPSQPRTVFVNVKAKAGFVQIAGRELWHDIRRCRPDRAELSKATARP